MKSLLLKELEKELSRLEGIKVIQSEGIETLEGRIADLKRIMELEYIDGKIDELEQVIDYIKQLIQEERNNKQVEILL